MLGIKKGSEEKFAYLELKQRSQNNRKIRFKKFFAVMPVFTAGSKSKK